MPSNHGSGGGEAPAAANATDPSFTPATVLRTTLLTPTVRSLVLQLHEPFSYEAGQWVDFVSDDCRGFVGGFSMCAPPSASAFADQRQLELAVKVSRHPASQWVHDTERCKPGAGVRVRAGGKFTLGLADAGGRCEAGALFVAGGIGVTALAAMVGELCERWKRGGEGDGGKGPRRATVLYSARTKEELALLPRLRAWAAEAEAAARRREGDNDRPPPLTLELHVTGEGEELPDDEQGVVRWRRGRISAADARSAVDALVGAGSGGGGGGEGGESGVGVFVCGPPKMTDELAAAVAEHPRVGQERVFTERWW